MEEKRAQYWFDEKGRYHRVGAPAKITKNGTKMYYIHGRLHRVGAPAYMLADYSRIYYNRGKIHNLHGPAWISNRTGERKYFIYGTQYDEDKFRKIYNFMKKVKENKKKRLKKRFFIKWELKCDQPKKGLFNLRMRRSMEDLEDNLGLVWKEK